MTRSATFIENDRVLRIKTATGLTCDIPLAPQFVAPLKTFFAEASEHRDQELARAAQAREATNAYVKRLEQQQDELIAQILANAPAGQQVKIRRVMPDGDLTQTVIPLELGPSVPPLLADVYAKTLRDLADRIEGEFGKVPLREHPVYNVGIPR